MIYKQPKRLGWIAFDYPDNTPPATSDGKKYLCVGFDGRMQVCVWDGRCNEWIYYANDMVSPGIRKAACESAALAAFDLFNQRLPKNKQLSVDDLDALVNICFEKSEQERTSVDYFDCVEWYMELPQAPNNVPIYAKDGEDVQAEIFEQELDLMAHIEEAIKSYSRAKAKIVRQEETNNAP